MFIKNNKWSVCLLSSFFVICFQQPTYAEHQSIYQNIKNRLLPYPVENAAIHTIQSDQLSQFSYVPTRDFITEHATLKETPKTMTLYQAVEWALQRNPEISQNLANIASQYAYTQSAKAGYLPKVSGGIASTDWTSKNRGTQVLNLNATQMVYDFGKVDAGVSLQEARTLSEQANLLVKLEEISQDVAEYIIQIKRYQALVQISQNQIQGLSRIAEITNLRAKAGISSQADPVQAQSYIEYAKADLISQQTQVKNFQQRLNTLLGFNANHINWVLPDELILNSSLLDDPDLNKLPKMMSANAAINITKWQQREKKLENYPTLQLKADISQALNGDHPATAKHNGSDSSIMFEANTYLYQGGANKAQRQALQYAEEAARARMNNVYQDIQDEILLARQNIAQNKNLLDVSLLRAKTTAKTRELYEEQYKLGTRTAVDLLNAEQSVHSVAQEIEIIRYDIYVHLTTYIEATAKAQQAYQLNLQNIQGITIQK